ncbi:MAG: hypothetical protein ACKOOF_01825 [Planctomycetaceae bacterium]
MKPSCHLPSFGTCRRGMLLLLVLLMLALFMGAGAILLTIALRARAAARATTQAAQSEGIPRAALDEALLALLRGSPAAVNGSVAVSGTYENLLHDKYGTAINGSGSVVSGTTGPVVTVSLSLTGTTPSTQLNGRILTIKPRASDVGDIASFRILGVSGSTCYLSRMPSLVNRVLPAPAQAFDVAINGREFTPVSGTSTPEPYDAPDDQNAWLAWPSVANNQMSGTFNRLSFCATGSSAYAGGADNDNDGIPDGVWMSGAVTAATNGSIPGTVIADRPSPNGGTLRFEVSYLVLDLDGRINLNAAGMADRDRGAYGSSASVPLGMGYGPADLDPSLLFSGANRLPTLPAAGGTSAFTGAGTSSPPGIWPTLLGFGTPTLSPAAPTDTQRRKPPVVGELVGRSGTNAVPGIAGDDTQGGQTTTEALYETTVAGTAVSGTMNSFADLKARAKVSMTAAASGTVTPQLTFFHPTWSGTSNDAIDDPYEIRLDAEAPRFGMPRRPAPAANQNDDSPFTLAELERILRPADADAAQLPQRLAAGLEDAAQRARAMITTESWDTPALTGGAARLIENRMTNTALMPALSYSGSSSWLSGTSSRNVLPAEVAAGLRFNINRPVASGTTPEALAQQHEYCKDLYTLVMALSGTASGITPAQAAQWAANVLDFRDEDSRITGFEYDTDLADGWDVDGLLTTDTDADRAVVWGAERPEFVITETTAYQTTGFGSAANQLLVNLHRPSRTAVVEGAGGAARRDIERPDPALGGATIALDQVSGATATWQLRIAPTLAVRFNKGATATLTATQFVVTGGTTATTTTTIYSSTSTAAAPVSANGYLCVRTATTGLCTIGSGVTPHTIGSSFVLGSSTTTVTGTVMLERLADPGRSNAVDNPYVAVDAAQVRKIINPAGAAAIVKKLRIPPAAGDSPADQMPKFWRQGPWQDVTSSTLSTYVSGSNRVSWFHWPNRPFVSQAELALVASGTTAGRVSTDQVLADYSYPLLSLATSTTAITVPFGLTSSATGGTMTLGELILEATHVPTRFAGNAFTATGASIAPLGFSEAGHDTLPKWREPGRVNINTIVSGTGPTDTIVWNVLSGGSAPANPFATPTSSTPARSIGQLLALSTSGMPQLSMPALPATDPRGLNPFLAASLPIRLANTATVRSNVFAVWVTVRITDDSPNAGPPVTKRLFAIIDRSIPVGYVPGQDWNVRDCIRLKRYLD